MNYYLGIIYILADTINLPPKYKLVYAANNEDALKKLKNFAEDHVDNAPRSVKLKLVGYYIDETI